MTPRQLQLLRFAVDALNSLIAEEESEWELIASTVERFAKIEFNFVGSLDQGGARKTNELKSWCRFVIIYLCCKEFGLRGRFFQPRWKLKAKIHPYAIEQVRSRLQLDPIFASKVWNTKTKAQQELKRERSPQQIPKNLGSLPSSNNR